MGRLRWELRCLGPTYRSRRRCAAQQARQNLLSRPLLVNLECRHLPCLINGRTVARSAVSLRLCAARRMRCISSQTNEASDEMGSLGAPPLALISHACARRAARRASWRVAAAGERARAGAGGRVVAGDEQANPQMAAMMMPPPMQTPQQYSAAPLQRGVRRANHLSAGDSI